MGGRKKKSPFDGVSSEDVKRYVGAVRQIAAWRRGLLTMDEAYSAGLEGAARALGSYKPELGVPESAWVRIKVRWAIDNAGERARNGRGRETELRGDWGRIAAEEDGGIAEEAAEMILEGLSERAREIVRLVAVHGERQAEVARRFGISRQRVGVIYHRALTELREKAGG